MSSATLGQLYDLGQIRQKIHDRHKYMSHVCI